MSSALRSYTFFAIIVGRGAAILMTEGATAFVSNVPFTTQNQGAISMGSSWRISSRRPFSAIYLKSNDCNNGGEDHFREDDATCGQDDVSYDGAMKSSAGDVYLPESYFGLEAFVLPDVLPTSEKTRQPSDVRKSRLAKEGMTKSRFVYGDNLSNLRSEMSEIRNNITSVTRQAKGTPERCNIIKELNEQLRRACLKDAEYVYGQTLEYMKNAKQERRMEEYVTYKKEAEDIRKCLPHFNIQGLWVGK